MSSGCEVNIAERSYSFEQQTPTCLDRVAIRAEGRNLACSASGEHYRRHWSMTGKRCSGLGVGIISMTRSCFKVTE
jgi:hypothetical protein